MEHIYNSKPLDDISDEISDIVVSTYRYNFDVQYIQGKDNELADYLSRNPVWDEESDKMDHGSQMTLGKKSLLKPMSVQPKLSRDFITGLQVILS